MRSLATAALCACVLVVTACSSSEPEPTTSPSPAGDISHITVVQSQSLAPDIEFELDQTYLQEQTEVLWDGDGEKLVDGQPLLLDIYAESLIDGTVMRNTFDGSPESFLMAPEIVGENIYKALRHVNVGGRVLVVSPPGSGTDEHEPVAIVVDVLPTSARGEERSPVDGMPTVTFGVEGEPIITVDPDSEPTPELRVSTLINGGGTQVRPTSRVTANYTMAYYEVSPADEEAGLDVGDEWVAGEIFDTSWEAARKPLLLDMDKASAVPGLQQGLLDQTEGSRVLMVVPPTLGYPERGSVVIIVDILDVWNPEVS